MGNLRKVVFGLGAAAILVATGGMLSYNMGYFPNRSARTNGTHTVVTDEEDAEEKPPIVKAVHPKRDKKFIISVQQLCTVEAFYESDLYSRVAGKVKFVQKDLGNPVTADEIVIELDAPELVQEVLQKDAVIVQREQELRLAKSQVKTARAMIEVSEATIEQREAELEAAHETCELRESRWKRMVNLKKDGNVVDQGVVDEFKRDFKSAQAACDAARAAIRRAQADLTEKESNLELALVEVQLKEAAIKAAEKDRDRSAAMLEFARIRAPFNGVITDRKVDAGYFVQNATTSRVEPLMTIARTDLVTVVMKVPDNAAPFVKKDTEAIIQINELPGILIRGRVTRFSPSIQNRDRTMRVEIDFFNGTEKDYEAYKSRVVAGCLSVVGQSELCGGLTMAAASRTAWTQNVKSINDPFPLLPMGLTKLSEDHKFLPGMSGYMRLDLNHFKDAYLIPSGAVYSLGGRTYVLEIRDGVSYQVPVRVQMNDGRLAKIVKVESEANPEHGKPEDLREFTGDEIIVLSRQVEIGHGKKVQLSLESW
jgi:multidrug resistance efflux pump